MPETSLDATSAPAAAKPFSSMTELWRAHLDLRSTLSNADRGGSEARRTTAEIRAFIPPARATGAVLADENERKTAQGILDYWSTELLSLPGAAAADFAPALLEPFDNSRVAAPGGEAAASDKLEDEARELIRFVATARLWRDSGKQPGYLLNDEASIAQAARFKRMDPDVFELVAESEAALRKRKVRRHILISLGILVLAAIGVSWLIYDQQQRAAAAEKRAAASIEAVEGILGVLSRQTGARAIPVAAAAELFMGAENILKAREEQPDGKRPQVIEEHAKLLVQFSDVYLDTGDSKRTLALAEQAATLADQLLKQDPGNDAWRQLAYKSAFRIGDVLVITDRKRTEQQYDLALKIAQDLASGDPDNVERQRDVTFVFNKKGDLALLDGAWATAASWYQRSLDIGKALEPRDPQRNRAARKIVGDAWARFGGLSAAQGHFDDSLKQYQEALNIRNSLVAESPADDVYQGNLAATYHFIGDVYKSYYDTSRNAELLDKAIQQYEAAFKIRLARANEDPGNASRQDALQQEDLAIADVLVQKQDVAGAITKYRAALGIREALVIKDPDNLGWKANLAVTHDRLAAALIKNQQLDAALEQYEAALQLRQDLAARFLDDRSRQSQLASLYERKADLLAMRGKSQNSQSDLRQAVDTYGSGLAVLEAFMRKNPNSRLEPTRDRLRNKMEGLASNVQ